MLESEVDPLTPIMGGWNRLWSTLQPVLSLPFLP